MSRILFLSAWFPYPPINGAKIRIYNLIKHLSSKHEITLVSFANTIGIEEARAQIPFLEQYCRSVEVTPAKHFNPTGVKTWGGFLSPMPRSVVQTFSPEMERLVARKAQGGAFDLVMASEVGVPAVVSLLASRVVGVPKILDAIELGLLQNTVSSRDPLTSRIHYALTWFKMQRFARAVIRRSSLVTVPSLEEKRNLSMVVPEYPSIEVVPHSLDMSDYKGVFGSPQPDTLVFTGSFTHPANRDAVNFFLHQVYARIKAQVPEVNLKIVGGTDGAALSRFPIDESIVFTGLLRDVRPVIAQSWLSVVPLRIGAGTRLKIIESMALGTPVVSTSKGAEGLDVKHNEHLLIADTPQAFAESVVRLLREPELRQRLKNRASELVRQKYDWSVVIPRFSARVEQIAQESKPATTTRRVYYLNPWRR